MFEDLPPEPFNTAILTLLYRVAEWHALAKLRMHTHETPSIFETSAGQLGDFYAYVANSTLSSYQGKPRHDNDDKQIRPPPPFLLDDHHLQLLHPIRDGNLDLFTPKFHALGDYVRSIHILPDL